MGRVLIADDVDGNVRLLRQIVEREGHHVRAVSNGVEALRAVRGDHPDLVRTFVDVRLHAQLLMFAQQRLTHVEHRVAGRQGKSRCHGI